MFDITNVCLLSQQLEINLEKTKLCGISYFNLEETLL